MCGSDVDGAMLRGRAPAIPGQCCSARIGEGRLWALAALCHPGRWQPQQSEGSAQLLKGPSPACPAAKQLSLLSASAGGPGHFPLVLLPGKRKTAPLSQNCRLILVSALITADVQSIDVAAS